MEYQTFFHYGIKHLCITVGFKSGNVDRSKPNLNVKVKDKDTSSTTFTSQVLQHICFSFLSLLVIVYYRKVLRAYWSLVFNLLLTPSLHQWSSLLLTAKILFFFFFALQFSYMILILQLYMIVPYYQDQLIHKMFWFVSRLFENVSTIVSLPFSIFCGNGLSFSQSIHQPSWW